MPNTICSPMLLSRIQEKGEKIMTMRVPRALDCARISPNMLYMFSLVSDISLHNSLRETSFSSFSSPFEAFSLSRPRLGSCFLHEAKDLIRWMKPLTIDATIIPGGRDICTLWGPTLIMEYNMSCTRYYGSDNHYYI